MIPTKVKKIQCKCGLSQIRQTSNCLSHGKSLVHVRPIQTYLTDSYSNKLEHYFNLHMHKKVFLYIINIQERPSNYFFPTLSIKKGVICVHILLEIHLT